MVAGGLLARLGRTFLLQATFISVAAIIGVFLASVVLEGVLVQQSLGEEAAHFWTEHARDPEFPLPRTLNLAGYLDDPPADLAGLAPGYHERSIGGAETVVFVGDRGSGRLYLFLLLARESETGLPVEPVSVNQVVEEELERARALADGKPVRSAVRASC
jgi:hypothetical protein